MGMVLSTTNNYRNPVSASDFYGVWKDSEFKMDSDELVKEIKASRTFRDDIKAF